ncbi:MAG: hypothetical protein ACI8UO_004551 [Verrucomicrobiales bacterium]|jgi:hypothetical protein
MEGADRDQMLETWARWCEDREAEFRRYRNAREGFAPKPISRAIDRQMADLGLNERLIEDQLIEAWEGIVGAANAGGSRPVQLQRGQLIIAVIQPALMYDLERFHKKEILRRLQERFGKAAIRGIRFRVGG